MARLFGLLCLGAAAGSLAPGFLLLPDLGLVGSSVVVGVVAVALAGLVGARERWHPRGRSPPR